MSEIARESDSRKKLKPVKTGVVLHLSDTYMGLADEDQLVKCQVELKAMVSCWFAESSKD